MELYPVATKQTSSALHCNRLAIILTLLCLITQCAIGQTQALICKCSECPQDYCTTSEHRDSSCFKTVQREVENNTYVWAERYGCLSGSDDSLAGLQCHVNNIRHQEPLFMTCCNKGNYCNTNLPDPTEDDDPRWAIEEPPKLKSDNGPSIKEPIWPIVLTTILLTCIAVLVLLVVHKLYIILSSRTKIDLDSQDSECSFKVNFDEQLKNQFVNHHHTTTSSSASTHTYTIDDHLSNKPSLPQYTEHSIASFDHTSTLPDLTSGVGTRLLEQRTIARVVDSGVTVPVGCGRFGRVFKGTYHCEDVAVKAFKPIDHESWQREEKILRKLNHENIVRYLASETYSVSIDATETWMFLEFCPFGSLCDFLDQNEILGPTQAVKILYCIIRGLNYLHEDFSSGYKPPIAHRDIKSRNILMRTPDTCVLADFGHAVIKINEETIDFGGYDRLQVGTIRYLAPEILKPNESFDPTEFHAFAQADLYQFGLILWEVCNRTALDVLHPGQPHRLPYDGVVPQNPSLEDMIKIVCEDNYRPPRSPNWEKQSIMKVLSSLMVECWRPNPKARMETLGVKKRIKELHELASPRNTTFHHTNIIDNFSL